MAVPPMKNATPFATEAFTLLGVGICVVALRTYSRIGQVGIRKFQPDDYLMLVAAVSICSPSCMFRPLSKG